MRIHCAFQCIPESSALTRLKTRGGGGLKSVSLFQIKIGNMWAFSQFAIFILHFQVCAVQHMYISLNFYKRRQFVTPVTKIQQSNWRLFGTKMFRITFKLARGGQFFQFLRKSSFLSKYEQIQGPDDPHSTTLRTCQPPPPQKGKKRKKKTPLKIGFNVFCQSLTFRCRHKNTIKSCLI